jgi:hypothetical protein
MTFITKSRRDETGGMLNIILSGSFVLLSHIKNLKFKIHRIVILTVELYGCEAWSLTLREEHRLRVFLVQNAEEDIWT